MHSDAQPHHRGSLPHHRHPYPRRHGLAHQNLHPTLGRLAIAATTLLVCQISLGVATFYLHLQVEPLTVAHHTTGAALLGTLVVFATLAMRD